MTIRERAGEYHSRIEFIVSVLANIVLFVMAWGIAIDAILRYFFGSPFRVSVLVITELYLLPAFVFGTAAYLQTQRGNINVDIFRKQFPAKIKHAVNVISRLGALAVFSAMSYLTYDRGMVSYGRGDALTGIVAWPTAYTWFLISFGLLMLCLRLFRQLLFTDLPVLIGLREPTEPGPTDPRERVR